MTYITPKEFQKFVGEDRISVEQFEQYRLKAEEVIDQLTNYYYRFHSLDSDPIPFRVEQFKKAICMQLLYFSDMQADTFEGLNREPEHISIGRTAISKSGKTGTGQSRTVSLIAQDARDCLYATGLLYRGI